MRALLLALTLVASACGSAPNTQNIPIGSRCSSSSQCGTSPFDCAPGYPGGYCEKPCAVDGDCPLDSVCALAKCRRKCTTTDDPTNGCRVLEGYVCRSESATSNVCELAPPDMATVD